MALSKKAILAAKDTKLKGPVAVPEWGGKAERITVRNLPSFAAPEFQGKCGAGPHGGFLLELDALVRSPLAPLSHPLASSI